MHADNWKKKFNEGREGKMSDKPSSAIMTDFVHQKVRDKYQNRTSEERKGNSNFKI